MKELLLWIIGVQKIDSLDSTLYCALQDGEIVGEKTADVLNQLLLMNSVEEAESLARSSGGLRTIRALWYVLQILKELGNDEKHLEFAKIEYPYGHLVQKGNELDQQYKQQITDELDEEFEDEDILND